MDTFWRLGQVDRNEPSAEINESDDAFDVEIDLPGVGRDEVTVDITGRRLLVHATRVQRERTGLLRHSTRVTGDWNFAVTLPAPVEEAAATASMSDGVLAIRLPKAAAGKSTRIAIR